MPKPLILTGAWQGRWAVPLLAALLVATAGCHKNPSATRASQSSQPVQPGIPVSATQQAQPGTGPVAPQPLEGEAHPFMTAQLRAFVAQKGRLPTDFAELARTRLDVVPRTPAGMTWAIDRASQEVKLVKK